MKIVRNSKQGLGNRGASLFGVMSALGMLMVTIMAGMQLTGNIGREQRQIDTKLRIVAIKENFKAILTNKWAWQINYQAHGNARICKTNCADAFGQNILVHWPTKPPTGFTQPWVNTNNPSWGFLRDVPATFAETCTTFSMVTPDPDCPFHYQVKTRPICATYPCDNPNRYEIKGDFRFSGHNAAGLGQTDFSDSSPYNFSFYVDSGSEYSAFYVYEYASPPDFAAGATAHIDRVWTNFGHNTGNRVVITDGAGVPSAAGIGLALPPGTYDCVGSAPAYKVDAHRVQLRRFFPAPARVLIEGSTAVSPSGPQSDYATRSELKGRFTLEQDSLIAMSHFATTRDATAPNNAVAVDVAGQVHAILKCVKEY